MLDSRLVDEVAIALAKPPRIGDDATYANAVFGHRARCPIAPTLRSDAFIGLARRTLCADVLRAKAMRLDATTMLTATLRKISGDPQWRVEYARFVRNVAYGPDHERIAFEQALAATERLVSAVLRQ